MVASNNQYLARMGHAFVIERMAAYEPMPHERARLLARSRELIESALELQTAPHDSN